MIINKENIAKIPPKYIKETITPETKKAIKAVKNQPEITLTTPATL